MPRVVPEEALDPTQTRFVMILGGAALLGLMAVLMMDASSENQAEVAADTRGTGTQGDREEGGGDDFDKAFGNTGSKSTPKEEATAKSERKQPGYIPPASGGGGEVKPTLEQSDIMEGVLAKKSELAACLAKKETGTSGKIVMKWTIQTSGKPSNVGVDIASEDLKGTPIADCFSTVIKSMTFPKHKQQGEPVKLPFKY